MNKPMLANILRDMAEASYQQSGITQEGELINVLARVLEGKEIERAFGAPGDWGYGTLIGQALAARPETAAKGGVS